MKKLFLTLTALSTLIFFSCASKPEAAGDTENKAPDTELNDKVYDSSEAELSEIEEPEITDLPPDEDNLDEDDLEFLEPDQLDQLPELDDEDVSDVENENDSDSLLNADGENVDGINAENGLADAEAGTQSEGANSTGVNAGAANGIDTGTAASAGISAAGEAALSTADENADNEDGREDDADLLDADADNLEEENSASNENQITPSRSVTMKVTEYLDVSYPGKGWIYMGATDNSKNITYFGRQLGTENTNFSLQARQPGRKILHFYKNDAVSGQIIDDYIEVIVETERGSATTHIEAPAFKMPLKAKRPVRKTAENTVETAAVEYDDSNDDVELIAAPEEKTVENKTSNKTSANAQVAAQKNNAADTSSPKTENGNSLAKASREALLSASENAAAADATLSSNEKSQKDLSQLLTLAKTQFTEKKYSEALKNINEYLGASSDSRDEALYLQGQILEAKSDLQDISGAINSYTTLTKNYPASKFWDKANKRIIYLQRFYLQGR
ncbi:hypothetical protein MSI_10100 [Treponema sp. JC4]|uniref:outer membrane protein assembly factor BamD n=1 Tax=Treponema sp. JC4 TaxID=1124982 RepID=UPI00025B0702|nr:outer membrane protein assembly factor BamD [Treponema sp. JC4]EID85426.1 hypothetical protein MSI_10100 [Treponema sp. JC4]